MIPGSSQHFQLVRCSEKNILIYIFFIVTLINHIFLPNLHYHNVSGYFTRFIAIVSYN